MTKPNARPKTCPLCELEPREILHGAEMMRIVCSRCGNFRISYAVQHAIRTRDLGWRLSCWTRRHSEQSDQPSEISAENIDTITGGLVKHSVSEKQLLLLQWIASRTEWPGAGLEIELGLDFPLVWAKTMWELKFYLDSLIERQLAAYDEVGFHEVSSIKRRVCVTSKGWDFLEERSRQPVLSSQAFVAMSFSQAMRSSWTDAIAPAIEEAGYRPYRVDNAPHIDRIYVTLMAEIKASRFVVCEVTEQRPGVYFEAGYAIGLGLPVIWAVRSDQLANVHFDTRQYNHLVWESTDQLRQQLYHYIFAVVGKR